LRHDHSRVFWSKVEAVLPNYSSLRKQLRDLSGKLVI
jgi:predicted metal-dependent hydrolase